MRQTIQTMTLVLLAGAMLTGCGDQPWTPGFLGFEAGDKKAEKENAKYIGLEDLLKKDSTVKEDNTAVDIAAGLAEKYGNKVEELNQLQDKHRSLLDKDQVAQKQIGKLQSDLTRAEKELAEANAMLKEMQGELAQWKGNVLGFRDEMRMSQKVLLEGVTRLHVLISGGVAMESPTTQPAPIASNTRH